LEATFCHTCTFIDSSQATIFQNMSIDWMPGANSWQ